MQGWFQFSCSVTSDSLWTQRLQHTSQASLSITNSRSLLKLMSVESVMPSNHLLLLLLPSIFPDIRVFSNKLALHIRWSKYWSFSFIICPSSEYSGSISFRMDWWLVEFNGHLQSLYWPEREAPAFQHISCVLSWVWLWSIWLQKKYRGITLVIWITFIFLANFAEDNGLLLAKLGAKILISTLLHRGRISSNVPSKGRI